MSADGAAPSVAIAGVGLWTAGYPSASAWVAGAPDPEVTRPTGRALKARDRRRAGTLARALADASGEALEAAGIEPSAVRLITGSAVGEARTMLGLLAQMWGDEPMSPAKFTVSVHNAAAGLISISTQNRGFVTSIAADYGTPAAALIEGVGLVATGRGPVAIACADEDLPDSLAEQAELWCTLAAAVVLVPGDAPGPKLARVSIADRAPAGGAAIEGPPLTAALAANPQAGLLDLVDAVARGKTGWVRLDRGRGRGYAAHLEGP